MLRVGLINMDTHKKNPALALFTIAKTWKQPKYPLTEEQIKMWHVYMVEY